MRLFSWSGIFQGESGVARVCLTGALIACLVLAGVTGTARANSIEQLLEQVGPEYGEAYSSPFIHAFGPNQNSNLFSTANIPYTGLTFGIGVKVMGTYLNEADQTFRKVFKIDNLGEYDLNLEGQAGTVVMSGPTIFGDTETNGRVDVYSSGVLVGSFEGIPGFWDTRWVPLATPEAYIGGLVGLKFTLRYFPSVNMGDLGKTQYLGYGLQWSASGVLEDLPIDLMVGFFLTSLDVENPQEGQDKLFDSGANSYFLAVSKSWPSLTVYGGFAIEDSEMKVSYDYYDEDLQAGGNASFSVKGRQEKRFTIGLTLDILLDLNLEAGFGDMSTYSAGLMFGF
jgi:hypothetical protein